MPKPKKPAHEEKAGSIWQRLSVAERITIVLTAIGVIAALLVVPEVRYFLHLEKRPAEEASKPPGSVDTKNPIQQTQSPMPAKIVPKLKLVPLPNAPEPEDNPRLLTQNPPPHVEYGKKINPQIASWVTVPESVSDKLLVKSVKPEYPPLARQARVEGKVVLEVRVGADGSVERVRVVSGHPLLSQTAERAVEQWQYEPYVYKGKAIAMDTTVTVDFDSTNDLHGMQGAESPGHGNAHDEVNTSPQKQPNY